LSNFVDSLKPPLRIPKPNHSLLVAMNIPICEQDRVHYIGILDGLIKSFFSTFDISISSSEFHAPIDIKKDRPEDYRPITTTLQRQRELHLCRIGLKTFRTNVERRRNERKNRESMLEKALVREHVESN
ncbi:unnamed protein product, partial [Rotaria sp. Silwood2]